MTKSSYGPLPHLTIMLDNLVCTGEEDNLLQCSRVPELNVGESDCTDSENAGVRCEGIDIKGILVGKNNGMLVSCIIKYFLAA